MQWHKFYPHKESTPSSWQAVVTYIEAYVPFDSSELAESYLGLCQPTTCKSQLQERQVKTIYRFGYIYSVFR